VTNATLKPRDSAPTLYRIAKGFERRGIRGSSRLLQFLQRSGSLDRPVDFRLSDSVRIVVPIDRNLFDQSDLDSYEVEFLGVLADAIRAMPPPVTLIDGGADIGLFSLKLITKCPAISSIIALEPNVEGFPWLKLNLDRLNITTQAIPAAIADFHGHGELDAPSSTGSHHTQYFLKPSPNGAIPVITIDSLAVPVSQGVVIKLDLEGGELAALRGARRTISEASSVVVAIEAHPEVALRTRVDPVECLRLLASLRDFEFVATETGSILNTERALFDQIPPDRVYNVLAKLRY
jgi:FkbM family methyltransferase